MKLHHAEILSAPRSGWSKSAEKSPGSVSSTGRGSAATASGELFARTENATTSLASATPLARAYGSMLKRASRVSVLAAPRAPVAAAKPAGSAAAAALAAPPSPRAVAAAAPSSASGRARAELMRSCLLSSSRGAIPSKVPTSCADESCLSVDERLYAAE